MHLLHVLLLLLKRVMLLWLAIALETILFVLKETISAMHKEMDSLVLVKPNLPMLDSIVVIALKLILNPLLPLLVNQANIAMMILKDVPI
jgi:hypothetical protein